MNSSTLRSIYAFFTLLFIFILSCSSPLRAQDLENSDSGQNQESLEVEPQMDCSAIGVVNAEIVNFKSFSAIRVLPEGRLDYLELRDESGVVIAKVTPDNFHEPIQVNSGTNVEVYAYGRCGTLELLKTIPVQQGVNGAPIDLGPELYYGIVDWQRAPQGSNLYTYITKEAPADLFTQLVLVQKLVYEHQPFDDEVFLAPTPPGPPACPEDDGDCGGGGGGTGCSCDLLRLIATRSLGDYEGIGAGEDIQMVEGEEHDYYSGNKINRNTWWELQGPARHSRIKGDTRRKKCVGAPYGFVFNQDNDNGGDGQEATISTPHFVTIHYNFLCRGDAGFPSGCGCEREVKFRWKYESYVSAEATVPSDGIGCNGREAAAVATDLAMVTFMEENDPESLEVLDMMVNSVTASCGREYSGPTIDDALDFLEAILPLLTTGELNEEVIDGLRSPLEAAFGSEWATYDGQCTRVPNEDGMPSSATGPAPVTGIFNYNLRPQEPVTIALTSGESLRVQGRRRWSAESYVTSSFMLASMLPGGTDNDYGPHCCTPYYGNFILGNVNNNHLSDVSTLNTIQNIAENFFEWNDIIDHNIDGNEMIGFRQDDDIQCDILIVDDGDDFQEENIDSKKLIGDFKLKDNGHNVELFFPSGSVIRDARFIDVTGRVLGATTYSLKENPISVKFSTEGLKSSVYFISVVDDNGEVYTKKFALSRF